MKTRSKLMGAAAAFALVGSAASAADLPVRKAAPVEYVRVCSAYGVGFFFIPGTDTCLRISGRARYEYQYTQQRTRVPGDVSGFRGYLRTALDARTQTAYGTLRAFLRIDMFQGTGGSGYFRSGTTERMGRAFFATGPDTFGRLNNYVLADKAFIQFAGITAGRAASFFDFYSHDLEFIGVSSGSDVANTDVLAYTASLGSGWSATISVENPVFRRNPVFGAGAFAFGGVVPVAPVPAGLASLPFLGGTPVAPIGVTFDAFGRPVSAINLDIAQRTRVPDFVGAVRVDQAWGSAQLSAAFHEVSIGQYTGAPFLTPLGVASGAVAPAAGGVVLPRPDAEYGGAIQGGLKINMPFIATGDLLYLQAAYARGALAYTGANIALGQEAATAGFGQLSLTTVDAAVDAFGRMRLTDSWSATAAFLHYWTPQLRSALYTSYAKVDYAASLRTGLGPAGIAPFGTPGATEVTVATSPVFKDFSLFHLGANLIWSPVRDLDLGVEVLYQRLDPQGRVVDINRPGTVTANGVVVPRTVGSDDQVLARVRVQRDF